MSRFEERGVEFQVNAQNSEQAKRSFDYSCNLCCNRGLRISCDRCAIRVTHERIVSILDNLCGAVPQIGFQFA